HDRRSPAVLAGGQRLERTNFLLHALGAFVVALVDHENIGNFHDAGLDRLHVVPHAGDEDDDGDIGDADDIDFVLADTYGFDHDDVAAGGVEHQRNVGARAGESSQRASRGHAADVNAGVGKVVLHADAVAEDGATGVGAGGIDGDDADFLVPFAIELGELVHQRALARARRPGNADGQGASGVREKLLEQFDPARRMVLN